MHTTRHFAQRMSQRGVSREMVELVRDYGVQEGDKLVWEIDASTPGTVTVNGMPMMGGQ